MPRTEVTKNADYEMRVIGVPQPRAADLYHALLRMPWSHALGVIVLVYLALNALFGAAYWLAGGVTNAQPQSYADAFFFSVQTMGTIGYGAMYPSSRLAHSIVVVESVVSLVVTAASTGLVFARFSQTRPRVGFSQRIAVAPMDGVPTLMVRIGNERFGRIVDAQFRMTVVRAMRTSEGHLVYRTEDLTLVRHRAASLQRAWMLLHRLTPDSPLHRCTVESLRQQEVEITVEVLGLDETSMQTCWASQTWRAADIVLGARLCDIISETADGHLVIDLSRFHALEPTEPTADFPHRYAPRDVV